MAQYSLVVVYQDEFPFYPVSERLPTDVGHARKQSGGKVAEARKRGNVWTMVGGCSDGHDGVTEQDAELVAVVVSVVLQFQDAEKEKCGPNFAHEAAREANSNANQGLGAIFSSLRRARKARRLISLLQRIRTSCSL